MKVGDLVKVRHDPKYIDSGYIGIVKWVKDEYPPACAVIVNGGTSVYDCRLLEVISGGR